MTNRNVSAPLFRPKSVLTVMNARPQGPEIVPRPCVRNPSLAPRAALAYI